MHQNCGTSPPTQRGREKNAFLPLIIYLTVAIPLLCGHVHYRKAARTFLEAQVTLEGQELIRTPELQVDGQSALWSKPVPLGRHRIAISMDGAEAWQGSRAIWYGVNSLGKIDLKRTKGNLRISTKPEALRIAVIGTYTNAASLKAETTFECLPTGEYRVEFIFPHFRRSINAKVERNRETVINQVYPAGALAITTEPAKGYFELKGVGSDRIKVNGQTPAEIGALPPGKYEVEVSRNGYVRRAEVAVAMGTTNSVVLKFDFGSLDITSEPAEASVFLNGKAVGRTPLQLAEVIPDNYIVEFALDGYGKSRIAAHVRSGEIATVAAQLVSDQYVEAMGMARRQIAITKDYKAALDNLAAALKIQPDDNEAKSLVTEAKFQLLGQNSREALEKGQFEEALREIEGALELKKDDPEAMRLKLEIQRAAAEAKMTRQAQQKRAQAQAATDEFNRAIQKVASPHKVDWRTNIPVAEMGEALKRAISQLPEKWTLQKESTGEGSTFYSLTGAGVSMRRGLVQLVTLEEGTQIRAAFWLEEIKGPLGFTLTIEGVINLQTTSQTFRKKLEKEMGRPLQ